MKAVTTSKMSPLHGAAEGGKIEVVRILLSKPELVEELCNMKDGDDKVAFELAAKGDHKAVCKLMKDLGDPNAASSACVIM